jgi:hypothetical protein
MMQELLLRGRFFLAVWESFLLSFPLIEFSSKYSHGLGTKIF